MVDADSQSRTREISAALERILTSSLFQRTARLRALLRFIVEERLAGREEPLKEYELGVRIFDRSEDYDPQTDPIVRVQARQLRFKLHEYYETAGKGDRVRIDLPKGSYLPVFHCPTEAALPETVAQEADETRRGFTEHAVEVVQGATRARWLIFGVAIVVLAAISLAWNHGRLSRGTPAHSPNPDARDLYLKGRYYWSKRNPEALNTAVDYFTQAIVRDPNYASAYVGLADSYNLLREFAGMPAAEAFGRGNACSETSCRPRRHVCRGTCFACVLSVLGLLGRQGRYS